MPQSNIIDLFPNLSLYLPSFRHTQTLEWTSFYSRLPREDGTIASSFMVSNSDDEPWLMFGTSKGQVLLQPVWDICESLFRLDESLVMYDTRCAGPIISLKYNETRNCALISLFMEPSTTSKTQGSGTIYMSFYINTPPDHANVLGCFKKVLIPDYNASAAVVPTDIHFIHNTVLVMFSNGICQRNNLQWQRQLDLRGHIGQSDVLPDGQFIAFTILDNMSDTTAVVSLQDGNQVMFLISGVAKGLNCPRSIAWTSNTEVVFATSEVDICICSLMDGTWRMFFLRSQPGQTF
ncbi:hypothetical protein F5146DRAFT_1004027 [Armillaria mellea]|nr:hypothetical protein F5146DRAFT_1004027 [Armillaria mellea]